MKKKVYHLKWTIPAVILMGLVFVSCTEEQIGPAGTVKGSPIKKESYYNATDSSLFKTIEYSYNSAMQMISKIEKHYIDTQATNLTEYEYDTNGRLMLTLKTQNGWTDDLRPIEVKIKTKFTYSSGLLASATTFIDSTERGFEQQKYYYTNARLDSINYYSFSVIQNLEQNETEYFKYKGNQLIEKGFDKIGSRRNTTYEYSNGLLTKEFNNYWLTLYKYKGNLLKTKRTSSSGLLSEHIEYFYTGNFNTEKVVSRFSQYSENPNKPYATFKILLEYW